MTITATPVVWQTVHPANVEVGDLTPAGAVQEVDRYGSLHFAEVLIDGTWHHRTYDAPGWVSVAIPR